MIAEACAVAHPNIALAKYWGKAPGLGNYPAVPSVSVTLAGLSTRTRVVFDETLVEDELVLDGNVAVPTRVTALLDQVRAAAGTRRRARVTSDNDFPTASGLASSASGFAALALAATEAAGLSWSAERISDLARRASASAARSVFGGFVRLDCAPSDELLSARPIAGSLDLEVLVCVTTDAPKQVSSTRGMLLTQARSPYYDAWRDDAWRTAAEMQAAIERGDFAAVGDLAEHSALAMHACAMAAGVVYVNGATLEVLAAVRALREEGLGVWATMDAGPHVKVLVERSNADAARRALSSLDGVRRILRARPGRGAHIVPRGTP